MNKTPKGVSSLKALPFGSGPLAAFDSSDVASLTKIESSFNSSAIDHLPCGFSIEEDTVLGRTAAPIMFDVVWMPHIIYLTFFLYYLLSGSHRDHGSNS